MSRHELLARVFREAMEQQGAARATYLQSACADDPDLQCEVEALLSHANASDAFAATDGDKRLHYIGQKLVMPEHIGDYKIIDVLGDGGMAVVYLARQAVPQRDVALKMIKLGMDTQQVVARFESEREALAAMDHPHISKVFDAGTTRDGKPYFVMEYVRGQPIDQYCDAHQLSVRERLELILAVCSAVEHAHQKGVIHRDLKPSNILVTEVEGRPEPKIIDFGIAKSIGITHAFDENMTRHGQIVGTPAFMSPEQAGGSPQDVDTRTDVFSIGVVMHELLVGQLPNTRDMQSRHTETEPLTSDRAETPSTLLRKAGVTEKAVRAQDRHTQPQQLIDALKGDLNWILLKALEPDRINRYPTASALARDLQRHLDGVPVEAHPPSLQYQFSRFVNRNRVAVVLSAAFVAMLLVGVVGLFFGLTRSIELQRAAEQAEERAASQALIAQRESLRAQAVTEFLVDLFEVSNPGQINSQQVRGNTITAREILDEGVARVERNLKDQPDIKASLLDSMARVYINLGLYDDAEPLAQRALNERATHADDERVVYAQSLRTRGLVHYFRGDYPHAESLHAKALEINRSEFGNDNLVVAENLHNLATAVFEQGRYDEAKSMFEQVLETRQRLLSPVNEKIADSQNSLASALRRLGDIAGARKLYQQSLDIRLALGQEIHPETAITISNLGVTHFNLRDYFEAERLLRRALEIQKIVFGESHPQIGTVMSNLGATLVSMEKYAEAEQVLEQSVEFHRKLYGATHPHTANALNNLGALLHRLGKLIQSEAIFRESVQIFSGPNAPSLPTHGIAKINLASTLINFRRAEEARVLAEEALVLLLATLPEKHPWISVAEATLGAALGQLGETGRARELLEKSLPVLEKVFGTNGFRTIEARQRLDQLPMSNAAH